MPVTDEPNARYWSARFVKSTSRRDEGNRNVPGDTHSSVVRIARAFSVTAYRCS